MDNEHYGKICVANIGGVDLDLIIVEFPVVDKPKSARCIDRAGTRYTVQVARLSGDGSKICSDEILKIVANAYVRNNPNVKIPNPKG